MEFNCTLFEILQRKGHKGIKTDFLLLEPFVVYDFVLMNPPFEKLQDIEHVRHAYKFLKPGGQLRAIMSPVFTFRENCREFREWVEDLGYWEKLPDGSFKTAFNATSVACVYVEVTKPEAMA